MGKKHGTGTFLWYIIHQTLLGVMEVLILEISAITIYRERECTNGQMAEDMKEIGNIIKWMVREFLHGLVIVH